MRVLITERISDNRFKDGNGYLIISNNVIARTGKQIYKHGQVYDNSDDMYTDVEVDRPANEVFAAETIASFENKPITIMHPEVKVNSYNHNEHAKGFFREIRRGKAINPETGLEEPVLMGTAVVTHQDAIDDIESGRWTHWSCGYDTEIVQSENPYQTKIRGNHIALTSSPRAGKIAAISDEENQTHIPHFIQVLTDALDAQVNDDLSEREYLDKAIKDFNRTYSDYKVTKNKSTFKGHVNLKIEKLNENANFYKTFKSELGIIKFFEKHGFDLQYNRNAKDKHLNYRVYVGDSIGLDFDKDNAW